MTEQTVNPDQLPEIAGIPVDLRAIVASPGGPLQRVKFDLLLAKLIATNLVKSDRASLYADLDWDADSVALVHNDPTPSNNGWYRKAGASGTGAWPQFEQLTKAIRDEVLAARDVAQLAAGMAADAVAQRAGVYDPIAEFTSGAAGAYAVIELEYLFIDDAGTVPATGVGDVIKCHKPKFATSTDYEQIQPDSAKAPILRKMGNLWYLDYADGKCMYSRANVSLTCPQQILFAGSFAGTTARTFFGYSKNTNAYHALASDTTARVRATSSGGSSLSRPVKTATTADYAAPLGAIAVYHSALLPANVTAKMELGLDKPGNSPIATAWADGDSISGMTLGINCSTQSLGIGVAQNDASCKCFGWMVIDQEFADIEGVIAFFQQYTEVEMRPSDHSIFALTDSTGDDQTVTPENIKYFAINGPVANNPAKDVFYRIWNRLSDCYTGYQPLTPGDRVDRIFVTVAASAGSQPTYFLADRFERMADIPHVDERIVGHGHNLVVTDATAQNHPQAGLLRLGDLIEMEDQLRARWPDAPVLMQKVHPVRFTGDDRTAPVLAAQDLLQDEIYRDITFARIDLAFEAQSRDPSLYQGDGVHLTAAGVTLAGDTLIAAYNGWVQPGTVTPPVINRRRIPTHEMIVENGLFEDWSGPLPAGLSATNITVSKSTDQQLRGPSMELVAPASGASFVQWDIDPTPYLGKTIVVTLWQYNETGSDLETGQVQVGTNGTDNVGNSWIYSTYSKSFGTWEARHLYLPIPADATTAFVRVYAGNGAVGTCYIDRLVVAEGLIPRDVLL